MCYCGDIYCSSCGPAQGNYRCYWCGAWSMDGGCKDPEKCNQEMEKYVEQERLAEELYSMPEYQEHSEDAKIFPTNC